MTSSYENDRVAVITGATKGLGRALSLTFASVGYEVIGLYRSDIAAAKAIESEFREKNLSGCFVRQDITLDENWPRFQEMIEARHGKHFTFIANASSAFIPQPFHLNNWDEIEDQLNVNVKGTFHVFRRMLPMMIKAHVGTFITILSSVLEDPPKGFAGYLIAKSALQGLTKAVAVEYAGRGLRAFSVSPGFMKTSLTDAWSEHLKAQIASRDIDVSMPNEIASEILSLAEDLAVKGDGENYPLNAKAKHLRSAPKTS